MSKRGIKRFLFQQIKPWALAGLRIGTGLVIILKMMGLTSWTAITQGAWSFPAHTFGSAAVYRLTEGFRFGYERLAWLPVPSFAGYGALEVAIFVVAIAWTIGYLTRITGPVLFGLFTYLFALSQFQFSYAGLLLVLALAILARAPTARVISVDSLFFKFEKTVTVYRQRLLQFLVAAIYLVGAASKLMTGWLSGDVLAILASASSSPVVEQVVAYFPSFQIVATGLIGVALVLAVSLRHRTRRWVGLVIGLLFHLGLASVTDMWVFNLQMLVLYLAFFGLSSSHQHETSLQQQQ